MIWRHTSDVGERYCSVHGADCQLREHDGDPMVLCVKPDAVPSSWICPQAVIEIAEFVNEARDYREQNEDYGLSLSVSNKDEEIIEEALRQRDMERLADKVRIHGLEGFSLDEIDGVIAALEDADMPDEIQDDVDGILDDLITEWEEEVGAPRWT